MTGSVAAGTEAPAGQVAVTRVADATQDGRLLRGEQSRRLVLHRAVEIASLEGLEALSLGRLSGELQLSKSGVFALFGSKEELQLATVRAAMKTYVETVVQPALATPPGLLRVWRLCENWLEYSRTRVFPGGCFFFNVSAEFDARPGRIRELIASGSLRWLKIIEEAIAEARTRGEISAQADAPQLAFELVAMLEAANGLSLLHDDGSAYDRCRAGILRRLTAEATNPELLPPVPPPAALTCAPRGGDHP